MSFTASWAKQKRENAGPKAGRPPSPKPKSKDECSDSDDDGSECSEGTKAIVSPISTDLLASIVIFGADGDLARKKILPTLFNLWRRKLLPRDTLIFGYARAALDDEQFRKLVFTSIYNPSQPQSERKEFLQRLHYHVGQFGDHAAVGQLLGRLTHEESLRFRARRNAVVPLYALPTAGQDSERSPQVRMYYMAVPPFLYAQICAALRGSGERASARSSGSPGGARSPGGRTNFRLTGSTTNSAGAEGTSSGGASASEAGATEPAAAVGEEEEEEEEWIPTEERFVLEKPFGRDSATCTALTRELATHLPEDEIYRIDHYLGKEMVMNLLVLRFANVCFSAIWNRQHVKGVQVIFKEDFGVEGRAGYFDQYGIIRDVMQNHLLQVMAIVAMEQPISFEAEHIRAEKLKVLQAIRPLTLDNLAVGQYAASAEKKKPGYLDDASLQNKKSCTETFAAAVLHVHNPRWDGVPFVLKAGKALSDKKVEVRIQFHRVPGVVSALSEVAPNELVVRMQPDETIYWKVQNKVPGLHFEVQQMRMDLLYRTKFFERKLPEAYERLLLEVLAADHSHFVSAEELDASWRIFTPVLAQLEERAEPPEKYAYGSRGPRNADLLARKFGMAKFGGGLNPYVVAPAPVPVSQPPSPTARATSGHTEDTAPKTPGGQDAPTAAPALPAPAITATTQVTGASR